MTQYLIRRILYMILLLWVLTVVSFIIIQLPPGDLVSSIARRLTETGEAADQAMLDGMRKNYGLDQPIYVQYWRWFSNVLQGNFGFSFLLNRRVSEVIGERLALTALISGSTLIFTFVMAIPIGIYSATHQYKIGDYFFSFMGFIGLATPNFLLALILMMGLLQLGMSPGGLFSPEYMKAPWSVAKVWDLLKHLPLPIVIVGTAGTAGIIRVMRATLLDELEKQYVITARAKGVREGSLLFKYPVRVAINPIISTVGWLLPVIVSGEIITSLVIGLPTVGPMLFTALQFQDMFLASSLLLFLNFLTVIGTLLSDLVLVLGRPADPPLRADELTPCPTRLIAASGWTRRRSATTWPRSGPSCGRSSAATTWRSRAGRCWRCSTLWRCSASS